MKTAWLLRPETVAVHDDPEPRPGPGEVILRTELAGICGTDVSFYLGHRVVPYPFVLGHEVIGRVAALGDGVTKFMIGQRELSLPFVPAMPFGAGSGMCAEGKPGSEPAGMLFRVF